MSAGVNPTMRAWEESDRARKAISVRQTIENFEPILDRVFIKPVPAPTKTSAGIHIPDEYRNETGRGTVLAVGPGNPARGGMAAMLGVATGDVVLFGRRAGVPIKYPDGETVLVMSVFDLLCVVGFAYPCEHCGRPPHGELQVDSVALFDL